MINAEKETGECFVRSNLDVVGNVIQGQTFSLHASSFKFTAASVFGFSVGSLKILDIKRRRERVEKIRYSGVLKRVTNATKKHSLAMQQMLPSLAPSMFSVART